MNQHEEYIVGLLLGRKSKRISEMEEEGVIPPFLAAPYARESAAQEAAEIEKLTPALTGALLRAAFLDEEEDVRAAARHTLILRAGHIGDAIHFTLTMDDDPDIRESAFDEANEVIDPSRRLRLIQQAVEALKDDECESVRVRAREFAQVGSTPGSRSNT